MDDLIIKAATIVDPSSPHNGKTVDIHVQNGTIAAIGAQLDAGSTPVVESGNLHVSPGWLDMQANFRDPGLEHQETVETGLKAAANGGYTGVAVMGATHPATDSKSGIDYLRHKAMSGPVDLYPIGALSQGLKGEDIAEMYDMHQNGAVAFSDDQHPVSNAGVLQRALQYVRPFNGLIIHFPHDAHLAPKGQVNEGPSGTALGLKGIPALAEELAVQRDLSLLDYSESRLHFGTVSTAGSLERIRQAKARGLNITAGVTAHHLVLNDSVLESFDSNYKVLPPLRGEEDRLALVAAVADGTIDVICTDHRPEDIERKKCEFEQAAFGVIGLESAYGVLSTHLSNDLSADQLINALAIRPRQLLNLDVPTVNEGQTANLTFFDPAHQWTYDPVQGASLSRNTPFAGQTFTGKAIGVYNRGQLQRA